MKTVFQEHEEKKGINKILLVAIGIGLLAIAIAVGLWSRIPTHPQIQQQALENAYREGSPEFELYTKRIIAEYVQDRTSWSMTGMGTIMMSIGGIIRNNSDKTLTGLEIKVGVVDSFDKVVKEKTVIIVPKPENPTLPPGEQIPVQVVIEGFAKDDDRARIRWKVTAIKVQGTDKS